MADSKENYLSDLGSERVKKIPYNSYTYSVILHTNTSSVDKI